MKPTEREVRGSVASLNEFGDGVIHAHRQFIKVARTVPGDMVRVRVPTDDKRYIYGKLIAVEKPSSLRVDAQCAAFSAGCGGCQWLGLAYQEQLKWKTRILREILGQRCSPDIHVFDIVPMENPEAYRNKLSLRNQNGRLFFMQDFDDVAVSPDFCRVQTPANQKLWAWIKDQKIPQEIVQIHSRSTVDDKVGISLHVVRQSRESAQLALALMRECSKVVGVGASDRAGFRVLGGSEWLKHSTHGLNFRIPLNGFFQTNYTQADLLLDLALERLSPRRSDRILDLYCGAGFFTLPIARGAGSVLGIENNAASTSAAAENAARNGVSNTKFVASDVETALQAIGPGEWDAVLLDPPRAGCSPGVISHLIRIACPRIVYVSCSPESLARDLKLFLKAGYHVAFCQPVDMFPHTAHIETVVELRR